MRRELKRDRAPAPFQETVPGATLASLPPHLTLPDDGGETPRRSDTAGAVSWFEALDPEAAPPRARATRPYAHLAAPLFIVALLTLVLIQSVVLRATLPLALGIAAVMVILRTRRTDPDPRRGPQRGLELDGDRLCFCGAGRRQLLLSTATSFGVTILATPRRDRLIALLTSNLGTFYLGAHFDAADRRALAPLIDRATLVAMEDIGLSAIGPDGDPLLFAPEELAALLDALVNDSPSCLDRFVLTDAHGQDLTLDGRTLSAGDRTFDLTTPLEWRSIVFQEAFGQAVAVYQGTWIRQSDREIVLVCLLPSLGPPAGNDLDLTTLDRSALRDLRLMQAAPEEPPPSEQRVAIERLFMLPLRSALDRAPRRSGLLKKSASP